MNLHAPERQDGESFEDYKARRKASHKAVRAITRPGSNKGPSAREELRNNMRASGDMGKRIRAADALEAAWASKRVPKWEGPSDEHGAYTVTGGVYEVFAAEGSTVDPTTREHVLGGSFGNGGHTDYMARRKWLGGISAQRGF